MAFQNPNPQIAFGGIRQISAPGAIIKGTIAYGQTTYVAGLCVGGLVTIATGLAPGVIIKPTRLVINSNSTQTTTPQGLWPYLFDANPSGSTFNENTAQALVAADLPKVVVPAATLAPSSTGAGGSVSWSLAIPAGTQVTVDASGNIYFALVNSTSSLVFNAAGNLNYRLEYNL